MSIYDGYTVRAVAWELGSRGAYTRTSSYQLDPLPALLTKTTLAETELTMAAAYGQHAAWNHGNLQ